MTFVPQTGQVPDAAFRPFLRVTTVPSNVRFALHFTQYASYSATPCLPSPITLRSRLDGRL